MIEHFLEPKSFGRRVKVELDLSNYATKADFKNATRVDTSRFAKKVDLASLKSNEDKLDIDHWKFVPINLNNLKSKVDELDVDKLNEVKNEISIVTNLATTTALNAKINEVKNKIPNFTNLTTTTALTTVENKIPNVRKVVRKLTITQKLMKLKKKLLIMILINILLLQNLIC